MADNTITVMILPGLWTAECTAGKTEHVGKIFNVSNPYFKCPELFGLFPGRKYEAQLVNTTEITLIECLEPFPR
jgi:hypothetical protein